MIRSRNADLATKHLFSLTSSPPRLNGRVELLGPLGPRATLAIHSDLKVVIRV